MKVIYEHLIGGDGAKGGLYVEDGMLEVKAAYPVAKLVSEILAPLAPLKAKLEALVPGGVANGLIDEAFAAIEAEVVKLLSE